jgi:hypothetical protein
LCGGVEENNVIGEFDGCYTRRLKEGVEILVAE